MAALETSEIIAGLALIVAVLAVGFTAFELRRSSTVRRGLLFKDLYERFLTDPDFNYAFGLIEQGDAMYVFQPSFQALPEEERKARQFAVEKLFAHFEVICSLHDRGLLTRDDMASFDYVIERVARNEGFSEYKRMLQEWRTARGVARGPYDTVFAYTRAHLRS